MTATPSSTYRLQIRAAFDLDAAADIVPYLRDLGVGWAYLSPLLRATSGSDHGYDVVDPSLVDPVRGGAAGLAHLADAAHDAGLGVVVDIVPNHMGVSVPQENPWWWDVLRRGRASRYADAFDIDWDAGNGRVRLPILGAPLADVLGDLRVDTASEPVLRYFDHVLPLAEGSLDGITDAAAQLSEILERQHYELRFWRDEAAELNYRRFFAVTTLAGVRVERPDVFAEAHAEILRWVGEGLVDGLRVDHPDGLTDPGGYLDRLAEATGGIPVWVEKILEHAATPHPEHLAPAWATAGTTGYDAMAEIDRVLIDPAGETGLDAVDAALRADTGLPAASGWDDLIHDTKRMIADTIQQSEIRRLVRCLPAAVRDASPAAEDALAELLACFPTYRSYLPAGAEWLAQAAEAASTRRPDLAETIAALLPVLEDPAEEAARRFQQTTGPVMAKGVEDTAFYRATRLGTLTEVGGDPSVFALGVDGFHAAFADRQARWPLSLTALSTHDTKRGEDVRARLSVLAEIPDRWGEVLGRLRAVASTGHGPFDNLLWQAIVGSWPATPERLHAYAEKAAREAGEATSWLDPDGSFEARMHAVVDAAVGPARGIVDAFVAEICGPGWSNALSAKLLQLAGPGVPDVYQGSELWETSLVDPDNRREVDFAQRAGMLRALDAGELPAVDATGAAKLLLVSRALRLRRDAPRSFTRYRPLQAVGPASDHVIAFDRGGVIAVATRLPVALAAHGGWGDTTVLLPAGTWRDAITGAEVAGGAAPLRAVLSRYPVALLTMNRDGEMGTRPRHPGKTPPSRGAEPISQTGTEGTPE
ncbi:MAG: malto-oligosyltrehalose synthase [Microbacterium sp.]|uniref:malto-oligosyltrehalose synthase n=1 Tax=Microbacterium sp. TaxID=51671 RepID=UPI00262D0BBA|nr:malto-oligosyltrehalose synthase [Microbacterium sp.]MCX6503086.1 malto-oligosyltrehalose synthase [Microbacterium sp.]